MVTSAVKGFLEALVVLIVGTVLLPVLRGFIASAINGSSSSETAILNVITVFWVIGLLGVSIALIYNGFKA